MSKLIVRNIQYYLDLLLLKPIYAIVPAVIAAFLGIVIVFTMDRAYYAEGLIVMEVQQTPTALLSPTVSNERLQFIEQRVLARENLLSLAKRFDLFPQVRDTITDTELADLIRKQITFASTMSDPSTQFASNTSARIGFKYSDPDVAAAVAEALVRMVIDDGKRIRVGRASDTVRFLVREVGGLTEQFQARERAWAQFVSDNSDAMPGRMPTLLGEIQDKKRELTELDTTISRSRDDLSLLEAQFRLGVRQADVTTRQRTQIAALRTELTERLLTYSDSHPVVRGLRQRLDALERQALQPVAPDGDIRSIDRSGLTPELALTADQIDLARPRLDALQGQRRTLSDRLAALEATAARGSDVETRLGAIQVEREGLQRNLDEMNAKVDAARRGERIEQDDSAVNIQIIETPEVPRYPTEPRRLKMLLGVAFAALLAGAAGVYVADLFSPTIRGAFDLTTVLEGQTLLMIPRWPDQSGRPAAGEGYA
ncbi:hypothetical protein [Rhizobium sp. Leaf371]|uniref:hypothetical protein n=1 Tax=Rhizobium sp. Leaf371 TaxID=1736355 RepID=UPI0012E70C81|nr:hypothetical protein [Rhizobium sp. Leaf371]